MPNFENIVYGDIVKALLPRASWGNRRRSADNSGVESAMYERDRQTDHGTYGSNDINRRNRF